MTQTSTETFSPLLLYSVLTCLVAYAQYVLFILQFFPAWFISPSVWTLYAVLFIKKLWLTGEMPSVHGRLDLGADSDELLLIQSGHMCWKHIRLWRLNSLT